MNTKISEDMRSAISILVEDIIDARELLLAQIDSDNKDEGFSDMQWSFFEDIREFCCFFIENNLHPKTQEETSITVNQLESYGTAFSKVELFHVLISLTYPPLNACRKDSRGDYIHLNDFPYFLLKNVPREDFLYHLKRINFATNYMVEVESCDINGSKEDSNDIKEYVYENLQKTIALDTDFELKLNLAFTCVFEFFEYKRDYISKTMVEFIEEHLKQID